MIFSGKLEQEIAARNVAIAGTVQQSQQRCQVFLRSDFIAFFTSHPSLLAATWYQATPKWNDGDECVFTVHSDEPLLLFADDPTQLWEWDQRGYDTSGEWVHTSYADPLYDEKKSISDAFCDLLCEIGDWVLLHSFGDDAKVTVGRDGLFTVAAWLDREDPTAWGRWDDE
jgi:hypothetical protein